MAAGSMTIQLLVPAVEHARRLGVPVDDLLVAHGLSTASLAQPETQLGYEHFVDLWDAIAARAGRVDFGVAAARELAAGHFDLHEYLVRCSATLADGLRRAFRFIGLLSTRGSWEVELDRDELHLVNRPPSRVSRHGHEFAMYAVLTIARRATARALQLSRIELMLPAPDDAVYLRDAFACPATFGRAANRLIFPRAYADLALPARDDKLLAIIERQANWMAAQLGDDTAPLRDRARRAILHLFQREALTIDRVARTLGMSGRSLQRALAREGTSFRALVDEVRRELALSHVAAGRTPIAAIAELLEFSDASAFHRSFRRWTGQSPSEYRAAHRA